MNAYHMTHAAFVALNTCYEGLSETIPRWTMNKEYPEITKQTLTYLKELKTYVPEVLNGSFNLSQAAFKEGSIDKKTKEMIALALGVANRCDGCIGFHIQTLVRLGVSRQELSEILGVAIYMGGGPSLMTAAEAIKAFDQFTAIENGGSDST